MNLSMKWLRDYVDIDIAPREYAEKMTMSGSKVEGFEVETEKVKNVVVGKILSVDPHPDADKLVICQIEVGESEPIQIVTGATNVFAGAIVPVAKDHSLLPTGTKIKKGKLRGVLSNGMLCSIEELNLNKGDFPYADEDGIFIIDEPCEIGQDICSALGIDDTVVEFEITSNRPDCMSVVGLARETAATFGKKLDVKAPVVKGGAGDINELLSVEVDSPICLRYVAKMVKNIKIEPSPRWMRERLRASGIRPINNIVDITNYVMLEYGYPMHAFDYKYVKDGKIVVRNAKDGETITTLDDVERKLSPEMLVIADSEKPTAVAGVMGGEYSGINEDTNTIVFESAIFLGSSVRTTAKKLGMRSESSARFEKGLKPFFANVVAERACELIELLGAGEVMDGSIDVINNEEKPARVKFEPQWTNKFLGIDVTEERMKEILSTLGFTFDGEYIVAPYFRTDIEHKADISEEIARIYGYDIIPISAVKGSAQGKLTEMQKYEREISALMLSQGLYEVMTYSFISPKYYDKIRLPEDSKLRNSVVITNPLGEDTSIMRTTAIPSMLETLARNYNNRNQSAHLYELSSEYIPTTEDKLPIESEVLTVGMYGGNCDFFHLKGIMELVLERSGITGYDVEAKKDEPTFHPGRCAEFSLNGEVIGIMGEIHPSVLDNYGIDTKAYVARFNLEKLFSLAKLEKTYSHLPKFPSTSRDLALVCDITLPVLSIKKAIESSAGRLLESVELFDVYQGSQIEEGKKSVAYKIVLRDKEKTLVETEIESAMKRVLKALTALGCELRA